MTPPTIIEPVYVLDTVALIRYLTNDRKLGSHAKAIFEAAEKGETELVISAISAAEFYYSNAKNGWFTDFTALYATLRSKPYLLFVPFEADDVDDFTAHSAVPEMHDRIIAGLAQRLDAPLITNDPLIIQSGVVKTAW
jgi:predicted nucleic acid-binding protein